MGERRPPTASGEDWAQLRREVNGLVALIAAGGAAQTCESRLDVPEAQQLPDAGQAAGAVEGGGEARTCCTTRRRRRYRWEKARWGGMTGKNEDEHVQ